MVAKIVFELRQFATDNLAWTKYEVQQALTNITNRAGQALLRGADVDDILEGKRGEESNLNREMLIKNLDRR